MPTIISDTILSEKGVGIIQVAFTDENGVAVVPNADTIKWTLTDNPAFGVVASVINSKENQAIASASTINIVLEGDDLALLTAELSKRYAERVITVNYQYDSSVQSNLDDKKAHIFKIENLKYTT